MKDPDWLFSLLGVGDRKHARTKTQKQEMEAKALSLHPLWDFLDKIPFLCELIASHFQRAEGTNSANRARTLALPATGRSWLQGVRKEWNTGKDIGGSGGENRLIP